MNILAYSAQGICVNAARKNGFSALQFLHIMDNRPSYEPLFRNDFVDIDESDLDSIFTDTCDTPRRRFLASGLKLFLSRLHQLGLSSYEMWIDGSFVTKKPSPNDVDVVCFIPRKVIDQLSDHQLNGLKYFGGVEGREYVRARWGCDYYHCPSDSIDDRNIWKENFLTDSNDMPKGVARIKR